MDDEGVGEMLAVALFPGSTDAVLNAFAIKVCLASKEGQANLNAEERLALQDQLNALSGQGQNSRPNADPGGEWITTQEAASILYRSPRHVTRIAGLLGGVQRNGKGPWWFPKAAVLRYRG
ncbi:hypothetical protein [Streptomyces lunaelactis]|uniref:hypothetical protein n=1 Tax=Streptomyces lunaelactis TaxID=1535768 RepID=UPI001585BC1C|nr:hypothetical protein [Streptomyces lunaelactis]NUK01782.1 hypothetical protein [Streptomyces lunaelactis]NUK14982.1 hypothetical protein [Streptomyces lunaelactis]